MKRLSFAALAVLGVCAASAANAAGGTIVGAEGNVAIERDGKVARAQAGSTVTDGDKITVLGKGRAVVAYEGLCQATVGSGVTVVGPALCPPATTAATDSGLPSGGLLTPQVLVPAAIGTGVIVGGTILIVNANKNNGTSN